MHCFGRSLRGAVRLRCAPAGLVSWQCRLVSRLCGVSPRPGHPSLPARVTSTLTGICFPWKTLLREFWRAAQASSAQSFGTRTARNERRPAPPPHRLRLLEQLFPGILVRGEGFTIFSQSSWRFPPAPPGKFLHTHCRLPRAPGRHPAWARPSGRGKTKQGGTCPFGVRGGCAEPERKRRRDAGAPHRFPIAAPRREEAARSRPQRQEPGSPLGGLLRWDSAALGGTDLPSTARSREQPTPRAAAWGSPRPGPAASGRACGRARGDGAPRGGGETSPGEIQGSPRL